MVNALDFAILQLEMLRSLFDLVANTSMLLSNDSIRAIDIWNVTYSAISFQYWVAKSFIGVNGAFDIARQNLTAMRNYSEMINFLGQNATKIFGNVTGDRGMGAVFRNMTTNVDLNFTISLTRAMNESARLLGKLLMAVNTSFV
ncbi:MAG: hypothetical protein NZ879_00905 [Archaeoglobaceae archaeon]|nr:hypothetical protein [Archaeoglobaceae archaeon]MDW8117525.1 hypothetical protein [Archaeoglobaceae archaeon]